MEQQDPQTLRTPSTVPRDTEHRSTRQSPSSSPSTSPLTPAPRRHATSSSSRPTTPNRSHLSISEPSLRFPRPQGSRHLANWISSSNPDIMRFTTTLEDGGLMSESSYELISNMDTEYQDGNFNESMSESIDSFDLARPDDVQSCAGTEQTYDDESITDEGDASAQHNQQESDDIPESVDANQTPQTQRSWASVVNSGPLPEVEADIEPDDEPELESQAAEQEPESEDEARSRSSLEYTQQSLKTPSIPGPDVGNMESKLDRLPLPTGIENDEEIQRATLHKWLKETQHPTFTDRETISRAVRSSLPAILLLVLVSLISVFLSPLSRDAVPHIPAATSAVTTHPTLLSSSRGSQPTSQSLSTCTSSALIPLQDARTNEWLWGSQRIDVTVKRHQGNFLIHMPRGIKKSWLDRDCLNFNAKRGEEHVRFGTSSVDEGILLKIPREETYGTVKIDIYATCRPRIHKVLQVEFGKGMFSEALNLTLSLAQRVPELVPAAAQEAERRLEDARRSLETASENLMTTSDTLCKDLGTKFYDAHRSLSWIKRDIKCRVQTATQDISKKLDAVAADVKQYIPNTEAVQHQARLELLQAQIKAKLWWLKVTASGEEHDRYRRAAKQFMTGKLLKNKPVQKPASKASAGSKPFRALFIMKSRDD
ncbi:hypothetical protein FSPOR_11708 [Fusarium sporotrichioides]|uniref:Uncharacterized protein n=1 Tax=Fusarium sporotrichioides TaxID=5514 RepID=A0A395RFN7_FUSSP|nr:hypothetical protein FSPOR_11708 [Fusarium sporotrichioides]